MNEEVVRLTNVTYTYPGKVIGVKNISLSVKKKEKVLILGPNGSGKTTLLLLINGLLKGFKGKIEVFGKEINKHNPYQLRRKMGLVFQDPRDQLFSPTVWDDVAFAPLHLGISREEVNKRVEEILRELEIWHLRNRPPWRLSEGEKKKVALATVIIMKPELLLLDEPFANLDEETINEILHILRKIGKERDLTLITTGHTVNQKKIKGLTQKTYVLNKRKELENYYVEP